jgi:dTDP-4-amino-4,6-dideoxygalactose transaminase
MLGDTGCFSFHARKGITTGEGGAITTAYHEVYDFVKRYATFGVGKTVGRKEIPTFSDIGFNYKMSDITAAIGVAQIKKLRDIIKRKTELAKIYTDLIESKYMYTPQFETPGGHHAYQSYIVTCGNRRDKLIAHLQKNGIESTIGTYAQHIQPVFQSKDKCVTSHRLFKETISLPIYYDLTEEQIHYIVDLMHTCH